MARRRSRQLIFLAGSLLLAIVGACHSQPDPQVVKADAVRRGDELLKTQKYTQAAAAYRNAVNADPKDADLRLKLVEALRGAEQWQDLARQSVIAGDLQPGNETVQRHAIEGLLILGRFDDAIDRVTPLRLKDPNDAELLLFFANARARMRLPWWALQVIDEEIRKGLDVEGARLKVRTLTTSGEDAEAEQLYRRAYEISGEIGDPALALGGFLMTNGRYQEALGILEKAALAPKVRTVLPRALGMYYVQAHQDTPAEKYLKMASGRDDRLARLALADLYLRAKRIDEAVALADSVPADDPDATSNIRAAEIQFQAGKQKPAMERVEKVLAKQPNSSRALLLKARGMLANGDKDQAVSFARRAVAEDSVSRDARLVLGEALAATGKLSEAFDQYSEAWRANTRDPDVAKTLARVALALGRHGVAVDLANQSLRLRPGDVEATVILARGTLRLGKIADAERALTPLSAGKMASPDVLTLEGEIQTAKGKPDLAHVAFLKALQLNPDYFEALQGLVSADISRRDLKDARARVEQSVARRPKDPGVLLLVARIAIADNSVPRAEQALRSILDADPGREDAALLYASTLAGVGRPKDARATLEKAIERRPTSAALRFALADSLEDQGQWAEAQSQYEKVMADNQLAGATTDMMEAFNMASARLAALFANQSKDLDQALQLASTAKRYRPNDPMFSDTLGWVHVRKERARIGVPYLEAALANDPGNPLYLYHLGAAHEQLGDFDKARAELSKALQGNPKFRGVDDARTLLKAIGR